MNRRKKQREKDRKEEKKKGEKTRGDAREKGNGDPHFLLYNLVRKTDVCYWWL